MLNNNLNRISHNLLFHKLRNIYILRDSGSIILYDINHKELKRYSNKEECKELVRELKIETLFDV